MVAGVVERIEELVVMIVSEVRVITQNALVSGTFENDWDSYRRKLRLP